MADDATLGNIVELYPGALRGYFQTASGVFDPHPNGYAISRVFAYGETLDTSPPSSGSIADLEAYWYECGVTSVPNRTWQQDGTILTGYVNTPPGPPPPAGTFWMIPVWDNGGTPEIGQAWSKDYNASAA